MRTSVNQVLRPPIMRAHGIGLGYYSRRAADHA